MTTTIGSLCSGYGGLDDAVAIAADGANIEHLWHAELDPDSSTVLAKRFPGTPNYGNLLTADWSAVERPDVITAGFPCQPVSAAGRQKAEADERWLWPGVLNVVRTVKPERIFFENVRNIASIQKGSILRTILDDIKDAGYSARWTIVGACAVGACHHRHRWFLVADRSSNPKDAVRVKSPVECGAPRSGGRLLLPTPTVYEGTYPNSENRKAKYGDKPWNSVGPVVLHEHATAASLLPTPTVFTNSMEPRAISEKRMARYGTQNAGFGLTEVTALLLPTPIARLGDARGAPSPELAAERMKTRSNLDDAVSATLLPTPLAQMGGRSQTHTPNLAVSIVDAGAYGKYGPAVALWEAISGTRAPEPTEESPRGVHRRMTAQLPEWMMGLPVGTLTDPLSRRAALRLAGNGVMPQQAAAAYAVLTEGFDN